MHAENRLMGEDEDGYQVALFFAPGVPFTDTKSSTQIENKRHVPPMRLNHVDCQRSTVRSPQANRTQRYKLSPKLHVHLRTTSISGIALCPDDATEAFCALLEFMMFAVGGSHLQNTLRERQKVWFSTSNAGEGFLGGEWVSKLSHSVYCSLPTVLD